MKTCVQHDCSPYRPLRYAHSCNQNAASTKQMPRLHSILHRFALASNAASSSLYAPRTAAISVVSIERLIESDSIVAITVAVFSADCDAGSDQLKPRAYARVNTFCHR